MYSLLPRIEAYREKLNRMPQGQWTPERAEAITRLITDDREEAERAFAAAKFASTPYE